MSIRELEEEIIEIEKVKEHFKPGSLEWNNIDAIITEKKRKLIRIKTQEDGEEDSQEYGQEEDIIGGCGGDCGSCGGGT
ncbi:MAG: hypothetical protein J5U17_08485 [Candidatus Methanoperedens sp.]|nr:hypothetical protein [Candidatus Methanoperedens sp.]MCE8428154.1 hypothetical protein [Candidatus Methanoperedens sp.]